MNPKEIDPIRTADCPVRRVIACFGDKWSLLVILRSTGTGRCDSTNWGA